MSEPTPPTGAEIRRYREEFPVCREHVYLNHAGVAAPSTRVRRAVAEWMRDVTAHGLADEEGWEDRAERARARFARLIGAHHEEVAFVRNTSHGLGLVAEGLSWSDGDRVAVATDLEYPSNVYPWEHLADRGVEVDRVPPRDGGVVPGAVEETLTDRTRLLAVSSAQYATGAVTDLRALGRICRERDVLLCVDGIQTLGAVPLDVKDAGVHFLSADSHKWLLGVAGIGGLFVDRDVLDEVRPVLVGWKSTVEAWNFDEARFELRRDARKFEEGSPAYGLVYGFDAALGLLLEVGVPAVHARIRDLVERLAADLADLGCDVAPPPALRHHILTFVPPEGSPARLHELLVEEGVVCSLRRDRVRISPHFFNTTDEVDRVSEITRAFL